MLLFTWLRHLPRRSRRRTRPSGAWRRHRLPLRLEALEDRCVPASVTWIGPDGGDWDTAANWSTGNVPGATDDVSITTPGLTVVHSQFIADTIASLTATEAITISGGSLTINNDSSVTDLTLSGGTLAADGTVAITGMFTWGGGTLTGAGTIDAQGGLAITGPDAKTLDGATLLNEGTATWDSAGVMAANGPTLWNAGTFTAAGTGLFGPTFQNDGAFLVDPTSSGVALTAFFNTSYVDLQGGNLSVVSFEQSSGATSLNGGTLSSDNGVALDGGFFSGPGMVVGDLFNSGDVFDGGGLIITGNYFQSAGGVLDIALDGVPNEYPAPLTIFGDAFVAGTLNVYYPSWDTPSAGDAFIVLTSSGIGGWFDDVVVYDPPAGFDLVPVSDGTAVALLAQAQSSGGDDGGPPPAQGGDVPVAENVLTSQPTEHETPVLQKAPDLGPIPLPVEVGSTALPLQRLVVRDADTTSVVGGSGPGTSVETLAVVAAGQEDDEPMFRLAEDLADGAVADLSDLGPPPSGETLSGDDIAGSLLTGGPPRADVLPQQGSAVASVATLLNDDRSCASPQHQGPADDTVLRGLLIDPVAHPVLSGGPGDAMQPRLDAIPLRLLVVGGGVLALRQRRQDRKGGAAAHE